ncbi:Asp domain containing protein [Pyrenophora tritici-repentis]|nr:Asp domain containing protein [Pyrenophora tritici-repentis]
MSLAAQGADAPQPYVVPPSTKFDGPDGSWSTFKISVGTPEQEFRVLPSTKSGVTFVVAPEGCLAGVDPSNCPDLRGINVFRSTQNTGFQVDKSTTWSAIGQYDVDLEAALNYTGRALYGVDTVSLGAAADSTSSATLTNQIVAAVADPDYYLGMLALGQAKSSFNSGGKPINSFLAALRESTKIPSFAYAYTAGAKYRLKSVFGSLVLGGYDSTRFKANANDFSFTFSQDPSRLLTVGVDSIMATNTLKGTFSLTSGAHLSVIDSTVPHLWLPKDVCAEFETAFGLTYDPKTDLYLVNDTMHRQLISNNPTITIKLVNSLQDTTINYTNIELPYAAFDLQASYPYYPNATNYFPIRRAANESQYVLGRTLLQEAYLIVDYERANFTVAQAVFPNPMLAANVVTITPTSNSSSTRPSSTSSPSSSSSDLARGAIVGLAIGVIMALVLAVFNIPEADSRSHLPVVSTVVSTPLKVVSPQELNGTPLNELATPVNQEYTNHDYPPDYKAAVNVANEPQELHGESMTPITPRWREVHLPRSPTLYEMDRESSPSRRVSFMPSDDGFGNSDGGQSGVSPLTPRCQDPFHSKLSNVP